MLPVGLLPDIGATFAVSDSVTGLLVSLYAVMVAALAVPLTVATSRFARKPLVAGDVGRLCVEQRAGGRRTGIRRCRGRTDRRRGDARAVLLVGDRIRPATGVAGTRRPRTRARRQWRVGRSGPRRAVVDVVGYRGRMAGVVRGSGCAVNAHVHPREQVAAAVKHEPASRRSRARRPRSARRDSGVEYVGVSRAVHGLHVRQRVAAGQRSQPGVRRPDPARVRCLWASRPVVRRPRP